MIVWMTPDEADRLSAIKVEMRQAEALMRQIVVNDPATANRASSDAAIHGRHRLKGIAVRAERDW